MTKLPRRHVVHPETGYGMGWKKDSLDARDHYFSANYEDIKKLPRKVWLSDFWEKMEVWDQSSIGSCTAHGSGALSQYEQIQQSIANYIPSRLYLYYFSRLVEGTQDSDSGATVRDAVRVVARMGAPAESYWGYNINRFTERPPDAAVKEGAKHQALRYQRVMQTPTQIRSALYKGFPITFGFNVYSNFFNIGSNGIMPMPGGSLEGGHCVVICGYDDDTGYYLCRNSWGSSWGWEGYFLMPYAFATDPNLSSDFWLISKVEGG